MKVTMKEIADRCGVSKSLVSRILNGDPTLRTTPATRERVLTIVEEAGYVKNINAQALSIARLPETSEQPRLGYVTFSSRNHLGHPYFSHVIDGIIEEAARCHGRSPSACR